MSDANWAAAIGAAVRAERQRAGLSQGGLAERCGILVPQISRLENGAQLPSLRTLIRVADALGVSPAALLTGGR